MSNLRASATIIVCVFCQRSQFLSIPPGQCTVFLEDKNAKPLDHPAAYSCIARLSEPFLSRLLPLSSGVR